MTANISVSEGSGGTGGNGQCTVTQDGTVECTGSSSGSGDGPGWYGGGGLPNEYPQGKPSTGSDAAGGVPGGGTGPDPKEEERKKKKDDFDRECENKREKMDGADNLHTAVGPQAMQRHVWRRLVWCSAGFAMESGDVWYADAEMPDGCKESVFLKPVHQLGYAEDLQIQQSIQVTNISKGPAVAIGALVLILLGSWFASRPVPSPTQLALPQAPQNPAPEQGSKSEAVPDQRMSAPREEGVPANSGTATATATKPLGERLANGVEALQPVMALETARILARCATLQQDFQLLEERIGREEAGAYKEKMLRERAALMTQERNCQTLPAAIRTQGDELQLRSRLLRHAYSARVPGAAAELLGVPQQFAGVPVNELRERATEDARAGDIPTLTAWALLKAQAGDLESPDFKVFAFALQRAASDPELKQEVSQAQAVYARVLEQYWAKRAPGQNQPHPMGFNMDRQGLLLYPQGFEEPRDAAYLAQARAMDAALVSTVRRMRKPS